MFRGIVEPRTPPAKAFHRRVWPRAPELVPRTATRDHPRVPRRELHLLLTLLVTTCGPKDPDDTSTSAATGTSTAATTTNNPTTNNPTTSNPTTTEPTTDATSDATSTTSSSTDVTTTDSATTGAPPLCGEQPCPGAQICVFPCCGGPAPSCSEPDGRGKCEGGQDPVPADQCQFNPCAGPLCCPPIACTPEAPFCVDPAMLTCNGNSCSTGSCFGTLSGAQLDCQCA